MAPIGTDQDWPYAVMQDLAEFLDSQDMSRTAEHLRDAALLYWEEKPPDTAKIYSFPERSA